MNDLKLAWDRARQRSEDRSWVFGTVGKHNPDASITYTVTGRTDRLWVTLTDKTVVEARNEAGVPQEEDYPVRMVVRNRVHVIVGRDTRGTLAVPTETPPSGVLPHLIGTHTDVDIDTPTTGQALVYDGTNWVNDTVLADVAASITAAATDDTIIDADIFGYLTGGVLVKTAWSNIKAVFKTYYDSVAATLTNKTLDSTNISTLTAKNPPIDADSVVIVDSAAANVFKAVTYTNVKAFLKTYFDTIYGLLAAANTWTANNAFNSTATSGSALSVTRNLASASTDAPVVSIVQDHASDDQIGLRVQQDGSGKVFAMFDGATEVMSLLDGGKLDLTGPFRAFGTGVTPAAVGGGQAVELWYWTGAGGPYGLLLAFDRDAGTYKPVRIAGDSIGFEEGATRIMTIDGGNVGILVNPALTPLQVHVGTNQNLGVALATDTTITAFNDTGASNVPLRIAATQTRFVLPSGGSMFVTKSAVSSTPVEIIPNAAGDVTRALTTIGNAIGSSGTAFSLFNSVLTPGAANTQNNGAESFRVRVNADGSVDVTRTAGVETYTVALLCIWS